MTPQGITRRLIAIVSADVKDYTRLISQAGVGTIWTRWLREGTWF